MGAAVAAGVSVLAPRVRGLLATVLRIPQPLLGLAEDYLALRVGGEALGLTMEDVKKIGEESFEDVKGYVTSVASPELTRQSVGAGSM